MFLKISKGKKSCLSLLLVGVLVANLVFAPAVMAQAAESVCDGFGLTEKAAGLCSAYCEAMDCDDANPQATDQACQRVLDKIAAKRHDAPTIARASGIAET